MVSMLDTLKIPELTGNSIYQDMYKKVIIQLPYKYFVGAMAAILRIRISGDSAVLKGMFISLAQIRLLFVI